MLTDVYTNDRDEPVMVLGNGQTRGPSNYRQGYLSREDSRNFRSSRSPPRSRSQHHDASWFGHRSSSLSPTRGRYSSQQSRYDDDSRRRHGRSPTRSGISNWFHRLTGSGSSTRYNDSQYDYGSQNRYNNSGSDYGYQNGYNNSGNDYGYQNGYNNSGNDYGYQNGYNNSGSDYGYQHGYNNTGNNFYGGHSYHGQNLSNIARTYEPEYGEVGTYGQTVKLRVPLCCEACEDRITNYMLGVPGVESVTCDQLQQKVTVRGTASPSEVLRASRECFKYSTFW